MPTGYWKRRKNRFPLPTTEEVEMIMARKPTSKEPGTDIVDWEKEMEAQAAIAAATQRSSGGGGKFFSMRAGVLAFDGEPCKRGRGQVLQHEGRRPQLRRRAVHWQPRGCGNHRRHAGEQLLRRALPRRCADEPQVLRVQQDRGRPGAAYGGG